MIARCIEELGKIEIDVRHRAGNKMQHADCIWSINAVAEEQTAFDNAVSMESEQVNVENLSRG